MNLNRNTYRKLLLCFCSVLTFSLLGCSGDSYPGLVYDESHGSLYDMNSENSGYMPITIFMEQPLYVSAGGGATRADALGTGPWDVSVPAGTQDRRQDPSWKAHRRDNTYFHVYSFREKAEASGDLVAPPNLLTQYKNDDPFHGDCLVDNTANAIDGSEDGLRVQLNGVEDGEYEGIQLLGTNEKGEQTPLYWSTQYQQTGYTFSMYHIDDRGTFDYKTQLKRGTNQIYYDIDINGQHDIMFGKAERPTDKESLIKLQPLANSLTEEEQKNIVEYGFSTYAAHRNVNPRIQMSHALTRLQFEGIPGDETAFLIKITGIEVKSKVNGFLLVASNNPEDELGLHWRNDATDYVKVGMWNADSTLVEKFSEFVFSDTTCIYIVDSNKTADGNNKNNNDLIGVNIGAPIMVSPMDILDVKITYSQQMAVCEKNQDGTFKRDENGKVIITQYGEYKEGLTTTYRVNPPTGYSSFDAGYMYTVRVIIYGLTGIQVGVDILPWQNGGNTEWTEPDYGFDAKLLPEVTPQEQWSHSTEALE